MGRKPGRGRGPRKKPPALPASRESFRSRLAILLQELEPVFTPPSGNSPLTLARIEMKGSIYLLQQLPSSPDLPPSPQEMKVLGRLGELKPDKAIARELGISVSTVRTYIQRLYMKTGTDSRPALARLALFIA